LFFKKNENFTGLNIVLLVLGRRTDEYDLQFYENDSTDVFLKAVLVILWG
jgi:hypothetical protein